MKHTRPYREHRGISQEHRGISQEHRGTSREHRGISFALFVFLVAHAAPQPAQAQGVDHSIFTTLLQTHVTEEGLVDYDAFAASEAFDEYLALLDRIDPASLSRNGQLAMWLNAYNAWTIELINLHDERESIRNINKTLGIAIKGPWTQPLAKVGGVTYTLDDIEHGIIRKDFNDPRIHFALVCAAISCPPLRQEAYIGTHLNDQLNDQSRRFLLHSPEKNRVDIADNTVYLTRVFDWYAGDFGRNDAEIVRYLARFFPPGPERTFLTTGKARIPVYRLRLDVRLKARIYWTSSL